MTAATLTWFTFGAIVLYVVIQDPNVYDWLVLQSKRLSLETKRRWYMVRYHPRSPWVRISVEMSARRLAKELIRERDGR